MRTTGSARLPAAALALLVALTLGPAAAAGPDVEVDMWVDRTTLGQAEPIQLTLAIQSGKSLSNVPAPEIDLSQFYVEGPAVSTRTNVSIVNFQQTVVYVRELVYTLYPRRTGRLEIGPARLTLGGQTYQTRTITVNVTAGSGRQQQQGKASGGDAQLSDHVFVRLSADRDRAYIGQPVTVQYDLCYRVRLDNVGFKEIPKFAGFWVKELFVAQSLQNRREVIDGVAYNVAPLRKAALFPTSAGTHAADPLVVSCDIPTSSSRRGSVLDSFFDDPFFGRRSQTVLLRSEPLSVDVLPLPEAGQPPSFTGAVGEYTLSVEAAPTRVNVGDPIALRVTVEGWGNLDAVRLPDLGVPEGIKAYDPEIEVEEQTEGNRYGGRRTYEYILIPEVDGTLTIPPVRFAYFDPEAERYRELDSEPVHLVSTGAATVAAQEGYGLTRRDIEAVGEDIRYIKPDAEHLQAVRPLYRRPLFWAFQAALPLAFLGLVVHQRHRRRLLNDVAFARRRRARGEANRRLKSAAQLRQSGDGVAFHAEVQRAVLAFVADRLDLPVAGMTPARSAAALAERGVAPEQLERLQGLLERCDYARFAAGGGYEAEALEQVEQEARGLITALERTI